MTPTGFAFRPHCLVSVRSLRQAPELASLALLEETLEVCLLALCAEHPTLASFPEPPEPPSLRRARRLLNAVCALHQALERYRASVHDAINDQPQLPLDSPF